MGSVSSVPLPLELHNELIAKGRQLEELSREASQLQLMLQSERQRDPRDPRDPRTLDLRDSRLQEGFEELLQEMEQVGPNLAALSKTIDEAAGWSVHLNGWFVDNQHRMTTSEGWVSPAAQLEDRMSALCKQAKDLCGRWGQVQDVLEKVPGPLPSLGAWGSLGPDVRAKDYRVPLSASRQASGYATHGSWTPMPSIRRGPVASERGHRPEEEVTQRPKVLEVLVELAPKASADDAVKEVPVTTSWAGPTHAPIPSGRQLMVPVEEAGQSVSAGR